MLNRNEDIKKARGKIPNWAIAEKLGIHENTFLRWLQKELPEKKKQVIFQAIEEAKKEYVS